MANKLKHFSYTGKTMAGAKVKGDVNAESLVAAKQQLRAKHIRVGGLKETKPPKIKISSLDIAMITRQLQTMMQAGVPLVQSYELIASGHPNPGARSLALQIKNSLSDGLTLANSLAKFPEYFDNLYVSLVDAGERSGSLGSLLDRLALYKEKTEALRAKIKKAITYPLVVVGIGMAISVGLLLFVVPTFSEIFEGFGAELPGLTQLFVDLSNLLKDNGLYVILFFVGTFFLIRYVYQNSIGVRNSLDSLVLKLPLFGDIVKNSVIARFSRTSSTMLSAGVTLVDCLDSCISVAGNHVYENALKEVKKNVTNGEPLHQSMSIEPELFPSLATQMIQVGEETGGIENMLERVADFYEAEVDTKVDNLTSLMEPMIMAFLGLVVGSLVVAMYLPIFKLGDAI